MIYDVVNKTPNDAKPLHIIFYKVDGYIRNYDKTKCLAAFHSNKKYGGIFDIIIHLIVLKSNTSNVYSYKYKKKKKLIQIIIYR